MSGRAETKMQIQIVIHGEAFCPSMMTKETPFANRKLLEDDTTNNERNEMEEGRIEENEIEKGHDNVEEEQDNKTKDTPFANRKLLEDDTTNSEKNEMEEGQMQENEIKEGHENVEEEQDYKFLKGFDDQWIAYFYMWNRRVSLNAMHVMRMERWYWPGYTCDFLMKEAQMEEYNKKERQKKYWSRYTCDILIEIGQMEEYKKKERQEKFRGGQSRRKQFFRKGRNKREQWESEKKRKYLGIWGGNAITQHAATQQSGKLIDIIQNQGGLDVTEKGEGKRAIFADCHLESRPGQAFNPFELHAECRPKCPFVVNVKKRNAGQTNDVASQTFPVCKPGEDIFKRNAITQHAAPQQSGKLIDIIEDHGGFDVTEKGGGNRTVYADCHLEYRPDQADNLIELHAALRPECPFVENVKKWNAGQTNDVATQTVPVREQGEDIFRGNAITQHAAPQQSGKLIDITEDQCEFDDTEKEIQELDQLLRCKVCLDSDACIVFLPCRHMATCEYCEGFLHHCPVCRSFIEEAVKINEE